MQFDFEHRLSDSTLVEGVWRTYSVGGGSFISAAASNLEMVITKQQGALTLTVRGPETKASPAPIPEDAEFFGITFKLGAFVPSLPASQLVNGGINLPEATSQRFWLHGAAWEFPTFDNVDTFVARLVREGLLAHEPIVEAALQGEVQELTVRSVQRRFMRATGVTPKTVSQIQRARYAMNLLQQGVSILDTVDQAGYYDQPHMTSSLKLLIGQTPAQIIETHREV